MYYYYLLLNIADFLKNRVTIKYAEIIFKQLSVRLVLERPETLWLIKR